MACIICYGRLNISKTHCTGKKKSVILIKKHYGDLFIHGFHLQLFGQAAAIRFEIRGGMWEEGFMQMDGEPWKQPMDTDYSTFVDIKRVPFQSIMIKGENSRS